MKKETENLWIETVAALDKGKESLHEGTVAEVSRWLCENGSKADSIVIEWSDDSMEYVSVSDFMKDWDNTYEEPVLPQGSNCPKGCSAKLQAEEGTEGTPYSYCPKCGFNTL
jgi:hypothetical protein